MLTAAVHSRTAPQLATMNECIPCVVFCSSHRESRHYGARLTVGETDHLEDEVTLISTDSHHEETAIREQVVSLVTSMFGKEKRQLLTESEALDLNSVYLCA